MLLELKSYFAVKMNAKERGVFENHFCLIKKIPGTVKKPNYASF